MDREILLLKSMIAKIPEEISHSETGSSSMISTSLIPLNRP
ncbi:MULTISPECIES: hypothetical protein [Bacillaceae]|nr:MULTISPECIES: hypothetical protein [Bacillaceae]